MKTLPKARVRLLDLATEAAEKYPDVVQQISSGLTDLLTYDWEKHRTCLDVGSRRYSRGIVRDPYQEPYNEARAALFSRISVLTS